MTTITPFNMLQLDADAMTALEAVAGKFTIIVCATPCNTYLLVSGDKAALDFIDVDELRACCQSGDFSKNLIPF